MTDTAKAMTMSADLSLHRLNIGRMAPRPEGAGCKAAGLCELARVNIQPARQALVCGQVNYSEWVLFLPLVLRYSGPTGTREPLET